jgi:hypothetical protein
MNILQQLVGVALPIVQAPMAGVQGSALTRGPGCASAIVPSTAQKSVSAREAWSISTEYPAITPSWPCS